MNEALAGVSLEVHLFVGFTVAHVRPKQCQPQTLEQELWFFSDAASTNQKDLHKELSALRVDLDNVTITAAASNVSQVQWKVRANAR